MEERNYGINWISLVIKVVIFVVVALLAIWLISMLFRKDKGLSFEENNKLFKNAAVEYFKSSLPKENEKNSVTLNQLISWDYLEQLKTEDGKVCNQRTSKATIEALDGYYSIKTTLVCQNESETSYIKLGNENCKDCDVKVNGLKTITKEEKTEDKKEETTEKEEEKKEQQNSSTQNTETSKGPSTNNNTTNNNTTNNNTTNNNTNNNNTNNNNTNNNTTNTQNKPTVLYEYVKDIATEHSDWYVGKVTGENIENSTRDISYSKYCKNEEYTYYTTSYTSNISKYSYKLELKNINNFSSLKLKGTSYFEGYSDFRTYLKNKKSDLEMVGSNTDSLPGVYLMSKSSLDSNNFSYTVSNIYKEGNKYFVNITINIKNLDGVSPYFDNNLSKEVYYVPVKFTVSYINNNDCIIDKTNNSDLYTNYTIIDTWTEKEDIYRYIIKAKEYIYSNAESLEGYTKTGKTKLASQ